MKPKPISVTSSIGTATDGLRAVTGQKAFWQWQAKKPSGSDGPKSFSSTCRWPILQDRRTAHCILIITKFVIYVLFIAIVSFGSLRPVGAGRRTVRRAMCCSMTSSQSSLTVHHRLSDRPISALTVGLATLASTSK